MAKRISVVETAKLVRAALKEAFPEVKFSVKSSKYSMGASIDVYWTDGPVTAQVNPVVKGFGGATFDGMQDLKEHHNSILNGEEVSFGADWVHTNREVSRERIDALAALLEKAGKEMWLTICCEMKHPSPCQAVNHAFTASDLAYSLLHNVADPKFEGRKPAAVAERLAA